MKSLGIFLKKLGYTSGVMVSVSHLCGVLERAGIGYRIYDYRDDEELTELVRNCTCSCIKMWSCLFTPHSVTFRLRTIV